MTGGAGFIGSAVIRRLLSLTNYQVLNLDKLTYAGNLESLAGAHAKPNYKFVQGDICDRALLNRIFHEFKPDVVMHLAAESHVDRSIDGPDDFIETNIVGTYTLLQAARDYWDKLPPSRKSDFRFHHISTDEVYGDLGRDEPPFTEQHPYEPSSPYSASKASSDHLVRAWYRTYGMPVLISNCSNNYGPYQFPEKLIPLMVLNALHNRPLPVYGKGDNIRDWLYVEDHAHALCKIACDGRPGETYNIGGRAERTNLQVVNTICTHLDNLQPRSTGSYSQLITFVRDRPGHDQRYAINDRKIHDELGWRPQENFETGLRKTVMWYLNNREWVNHVNSGEYRDWLKVNYENRPKLTGKSQSS